MEEMVRPKKYQSYFSRIIRNFRFFSKAVPSGVKVSFSKVLAIAIPFHLYISQLMDFRWDSIHWYHLYWRRLSTWDYLCLGTRTLGRCPKSWGTISHWAWMNLCFKNLTKKLAMLLGEQQLELQPQLQHCMISTQETMNWAGWARDSTFCHFYFRPPEDTIGAKAFGRAVLRPEPTQTTNMWRTCWWSRVLQSTMAKSGCSWMLFPIVWGGWRWISTCPSHPSHPR